MKVITHNDIKEINRLYLELKTYAAVSRATGFSPATVKKYVVNGFSNIQEDSIIHYEGNLPEFDSSIFRSDDWGGLCVLSNEEIIEIKELWKEIEL